MKLPSHLQAIKRKLGLTLIKFEDATIELEPFVKRHPFENIQFLLHSIIKHYKDVQYLIFLINFTNVYVPMKYHINFKIFTGIKMASSCYIGIRRLSG